MIGDWATVAIGKMAMIVNGGTPKIGVDEYWHGDVLWITPKDMGQLKDDYVADTSRKITELGLDKSSAKLIPIGSVILSTRAPIGHLAINLEQMATNQGCRGLVPSSNLDAKFLFYFLRMNVELLNELGSGTTFKELSKSVLSDIEIPLPPINEQKRIVKILDQVFTEIEKARANAEQNLKNARELFESYLQQVFNQRGEGWVEKTLKEVSVDFGRGKSKHRPRNEASLYGGDYPFIQTGEVRNCEHIISNYSKTYNEKGLAQSKLWPKGTICITIAANIAETGILDFDACFPDSVIGVVVNPEITTIRFVEYLLQSFKVILQAKGQGSAQDNINMGTFENQNFPFPCLDMQHIIVNSLDSLMNSVQKLEKIYSEKLIKYDELKKSILQKAFTGQLTQGKAA